MGATARDCAFCRLSGSIRRVPHSPVLPPPNRRSSFRSQTASERLGMSLHQRSMTIMINNVELLVQHKNELKLIKSTLPGEINLETRDAKSQNGKKEKKAKPEKLDDGPSSKDGHSDTGQDTSEASTSLLPWQKQAKHFPGAMILLNDVQDVNVVEEEGNQVVEFIYKPAHERATPKTERFLQENLKRPTEEHSYSFALYQPDELLTHIKEFLDSKIEQITYLVEKVDREVLSEELETQPRTPHVTTVTGKYMSRDRPMYEVAYRINSVPLGAFHVSSNGLHHADCYIIAKDHGNNWHIFFDSTKPDTTTYSEVRKCFINFANNPNQDLLKKLKNAAICDFIRRLNSTTFSRTLFLL